MTKPVTAFSMLLSLFAFSCSATVDAPGGGASSGGMSGGSPAGGAASGGSPAGGAASGGSPAGGAASGGSPAGGAAGSAGSGGSAGTLGGFGGSGGTGMIDPYVLDCGPLGQALESAGPPENRVNYVVVGEGYDDQEIETTFIEHVQGTLDRRLNHETGEPFGRYRKFVNICAMKSAGSGSVGSPFGGSISGRVSNINSGSVTDWLDENLPMNLEADWVAVSFNITSWNNVGGAVMLFAGGNENAAGAALHEGGHGHHQLADEYGGCTGAGCGTDTNGQGSVGDEYDEINSTGNPMTTGGKWDLWMGHVQKGIRDPSLDATGVQSTFQGSRYEPENGDQYRPSDNSMMNSLFGMNMNTSFNAISREQIIYTIWREIKPIDKTEPPAGAVSGAMTLQVFVIDTAVIDVDWSIDGAVVAAKGGTSFNLAGSGLGAGTYTVSARAYDNAGEDLVRYRSGVCPESVGGRYCHAPGWLNSTETVEWTVTLP